MSLWKFLGLWTLLCLVLTVEVSEAAEQCATYGYIYSFKYSDDNTTGCIGLNADDFTAGAGDALYFDTYCGGKSYPVKFVRSGDSIELSSFSYKSCQHPTWDLRAEMKLVKVDGSCFSRLEFSWIGTRTEEFMAHPVTADCKPAS